MSSQPSTVGELIHWSYANLAMAHAAVAAGRGHYGRLDFTIRARMFRDLEAGVIQIRSLLDDERIKMVSSVCAYCGSDKRPSVDHLQPKARGGTDAAENLVLACRHCNSSKGAKDLMEWMSQRGRFLPLMVIRRYIKLLRSYCVEHELLQAPVPDSVAEFLPFRIDLLPTSFPQPGGLTLVAEPNLPSV